jgi:hypothetical protein
VFPRIHRIPRNFSIVGQTASSAPVLSCPRHSGHARERTLNLELFIGDAFLFRHWFASLWSAS